MSIDTDVSNKLMMRMGLRFEALKSELKDGEQVLIECYLPNGTVVQATHIKATDYDFVIIEGQDEKGEFDFYVSIHSIQIKLSKSMGSRKTIGFSSSKE